jgi:hypothetical protein
MRRRPLPWMVLTLCLAGCVQQPQLAIVPVRTIAVLPPNNRTGDRLLIAGASFLEKYILSTEPSPTRSARKPARNW